MKSIFKSISKVSILVLISTEIHNLHCIRCKRRLLYSHNFWSLFKNNISFKPFDDWWLIIHHQILVPCEMDLLLELLFWHQFSSEKEEFLSTEMETYLWMLSKTLLHLMSHVREVKDPERNYFLPSVTCARLSIYFPGLASKTGHYNGTLLKRTEKDPFKMYLLAPCLVRFILQYLFDILNRISFSCDGNVMRKSLEEHRNEHVWRLKRQFKGLLWPWLSHWTGYSCVNPGWAVCKQGFDNAMLLSLARAQITHVSFNYNISHHVFDLNKIYSRLFKHICVKSYWIKWVF